MFFTVANSESSDPETVAASAVYIEGPQPIVTLVNKSFNSEVKKPLNTILGLGLGEENRWYVGLEYSFQNAIDFTNGVLANNTRVSYDKMNRVSVGGFYIPKISFAIIK